jgi:hypothetical protein
MVEDGGAKINGWEISKDIFESVLNTVSGAFPSIQPENLSLMLPEDGRLLPYRFIRVLNEGGIIICAISEDKFQSKKPDVGILDHISISGKLIDPDNIPLFYCANVAVTGRVRDHKLPPVDDAAIDAQYYSFSFILPIGTDRKPIPVSTFCSEYNLPCQIRCESTGDPSTFYLIPLQF